MKKVIAAFPEIETGLHLHSTPSGWKQKIDAALQSGCMRFDGAIKGFGGCPMAKDKLIGNMNTDLMVPYFEELGLLKNFNKEALLKAGEIASKIFI